MTKKQLIRKRNKLVQISTALSGENQKAIELAIALLDYIIDNK